MKPVDVKSSTYIDFNKEKNKEDPKFEVGNDFNKEKNKEDPKFEVGNHVRISKYKTFLQKVALQVGL